MTIQEFEDAVFQKEGIRMAIRGLATDAVDDYSYANCAPAAWRLKELLDTRIHNKIGGRKVVVIGGNGKTPHKGSLVRTIRNSYHKT